MRGYFEAIGVLAQKNDANRFSPHRRREEKKEGSRLTPFGPLSSALRLATLSIHAGGEGWGEEVGTTSLIWISVPVFQSAGTR